MELHGSTDLRGPLKKEAINISMSFSATLWSGNVVYCIYRSTWKLKILIIKQYISI